MATLRLYLDTRVKRQDGTFSIRHAVNHHGGTAFISLNQYCKKDEWDKRACKVRKRPDRDAINDFLLDRLNFYNRMMMKAQCRETYRGDITARELRDLIMLEAEPAREKVALLRDGFIAYEGRNLKENTINRYKYTWAKIEAFLGKEKAALLTYDEINRSWLEDFDAFMAKEGLSRNTRASRMLCVAAVFNLAIDNEQTKNYPFRRYSLRLETTKKRNLSVEEIRSIFEAGGDELVDMFLPTQMNEQELTAAIKSIIADVQGSNVVGYKVTIKDVMPRLQAEHAGKFDGKMLTEDQKHLYSIYKRLLTLCNEEKAISQGAFFDLMYANVNGWRFNEHKQYTFLRKFERDLLLFVVNFDHISADLAINIPSHAFDFLQIPQMDQYKATELLSGKEENISLLPYKATNVAVEGYGGKILKIKL
jgi:hypothetical protein